MRKGQMLPRALLVLAMLATGCGTNTGATEQPPAARSTPTPATTEAASQNGCPVTIPPQPGFEPPEPYPPRPPELYQAEWYGSEELWTMLAPDGEVWRDLPGDGHGKFTQKTLWWSEDLSAGGNPTPITLTGRRVDRAGSLEASKSIGASFREDIHEFMIVGLAIPAGCWELTARYGDAELSYVVLVRGLGGP